MNLDQFKLFCTSITIILAINLIAMSFSYFLQVNTFQCILATSDSESFVMFLYSDLQWTTGVFSFWFRGFGRNEALAGYNAGDGINSYTIPGSQTSEILKLSRTSNVGIPGTWIFKVGKGTYVSYKTILCILFFKVATL